MESNHEASTKRTYLSFPATYNMPLTQIKTLEVLVFMHLKEPASQWIVDNIDLPFAATKAKGIVALISHPIL